MKKSVVWGMGISAFVVSSALADVSNTRPVFTAGTTLDSLQSVFAGIGSSINVRTQQESAAQFTHSTTGSNATYVASLSWDTLNFPFEFGIYEVGNIGNRVAVFDDADDGTTGTGHVDAGDFTTIVFDSTLGAVYSEYHDAGTLGSSIIDSTFSYFDNFGFFFEWADQSGNVMTYYSEDSLNGGTAAFLAYQGNGDSVNIGGQMGNDANHWYVAMEGYGGVTDFNDIVVQLESINPLVAIPAPGAAILAMMGLGIIGTVKRRFA